jgi:hypothetical protein
MAEEPRSSKSEPDADAVAQAQLMGAAFRNPMVPKLYGNLMVIGQSASDVSIIVATNGVPNAVVSMSYITAKSLIDDLSTAVEAVEKATGSAIPSIREITPKLQANMDPNTNVKV